MLDYKPPVIYDYKKAWLRWHEENKHLNLTHRDLPDELIQTQIQIEKKHGISFGMFSHEMEMEHPYHWSDKIVGNACANHPEKIKYLDNDTPGIRKVDISLLYVWLTSGTFLVNSIYKYHFFL